MEINKMMIMKMKEYNKKIHKPYTYKNLKNNYYIIKFKIKN